MNGELYSIYRMLIRHQNFPVFEELVARIVEATRLEDDTMTYE